jgi:glycosyltransferase involved in cell wall biosynthesis
MLMDVFVQVILGVVALICLFPLLVLSAEALLAVFSRSTRGLHTEKGSRLAILIPAHNEEHGIGKTLTDIVGGLRPGDRCVVVADNCQDGTAQAARAFAVEVLERNDLSRNGKGYALEHGMNHLRADPPEVVLVIDADCQVDRAGVHTLADVAATSGHPIQGGNVLYPPPESGVGSRVSSFAFLFKNHIRTLGMAQIGGPCLLFGTGMAFPWSLASTIQWATADSVEDMQLAVKLAMEGKSARYADVPCVSGILPSGKSAARSQRRRWEHGHLRTILKYAPRLIGIGLLRGKLQLLLLGCDLAVPPLSLLAMIVLAAGVVLATGWWFTGIWIWTALLGCAAGLAGVSFLLAWARFGRSILSFRDLVLIPVYIVSKLPIYFGLLWKPQSVWNKREPVTASSGVKENSL